jgi:flagellar biosynthesis protein FlhB
MKTVQFDTSVITMYFRWHMYALLVCQKGDLSASDNLINSYLCIHWFFEKVKSRFPTVFQRTSCTLQHSFEVQRTIKSTQYIQKYINVLLDVLCTLFPFLVEKILILTCQCTFGRTLYFQKSKVKVQSTSKGTKYIQKYKVHHACMFQSIFEN